MSTFQDMKKTAKRLREEINEILKIDREELYGEKRLHELSFNHHGKEQFEMVFKLIEDLSKCHLEWIPEKFIEPIIGQLETYKEIFINEAKVLNLKEDENPMESRNLIVSKIEKQYLDFFEAASKVISFANQDGTDFEQIENNKQESFKILEAMRSASAETGVSQNAIHYSKAQKDHAHQAQKWYKWGKSLLFALIIATAVAGIVFFFISKKLDLDRLVLVYLEIATIVVFSLWVYAVNFCNKNFHAEKHNEMINANKARTLATFRSFVDATEDESIKNQILLQAGLSAFSNPSTGFGKNQGPPLPPGWELIKQFKK